MDADPEKKISIYGYASKEGLNQRNLQLSQDRADRVKNDLISQGISKERISTVKGEGETSKFGDDLDKNRRTQIKFTYEKR